MSFLLSLFLLSQFPACWASCHFHCAEVSLHSASTAGAFADLGFCCVWPLPCRDQAELLSARLNPRNGTIDVRGVCNFLGSVLPQQKFEVTDGSVLQLSFIWQAKENTSSRHEGGPTQTIWREQKPNFGSCFYVCSPSPDLPYANWASQEGCLFYLRSSIRSSDLPLFYFHWLFPSLSFSHRHSGLLFPILTLSLLFNCYKLCKGR